VRADDRLVITRSHKIWWSRFEGAPGVVVFASEGQPPLCVPSSRPTQAGQRGAMCGRVSVHDVLLACVGTGINGAQPWMCEAVSRHADWMHLITGAPADYSSNRQK